MNPLESLLAWLAQVSTAERAAIIAGGFAALFALELGLGATSFARVRHARTNLALWATTLLVNAAFAAATLGASFAVDAAHFGLLHVWALPLWLEVVLSIALMVVSIWILFVVGARVYAGAVLQVGSRMKLRDAWRARS